jgi:hypothetical protein
MVILSLILKLQLIDEIELKYDIMISYVPLMIIKSSKYITKSANYYCETFPYLIIFSIDEKRGLYRSACYGWTTHRMSHGNVVPYYKKYVPTHIQESLKVLCDSIAS